MEVVSEMIGHPVPMAFHGFGGWKQSLYGDHHVHGPEGVRFYTRLKAVTQRWPTSIEGALNLPCRSINKEFPSNHASSTQYRD